MPLTIPTMRRIGSPRRLSRRTRTERDATGDGSLEQEVHAVAIGRLEQLDTDVGEQLLVRRDDRFAGGDGGGDQLAGRLDAADDLDDEVDVGIDHDVVGITRQHTGVQLHAPLS